MFAGPECHLSFFFKIGRAQRLHHDAVSLCYLFVCDHIYRTAHAQFTVGGVTGNAPTTDVNCYGDADGKILAYSEGWTAADCGIYTLVCNANQVYMSASQYVVY